jgi:hypothetical protein
MLIDCGWVIDVVNVEFLGQAEKTLNLLVSPIFLSACKT